MPDTIALRRLRAVLEPHFDETKTKTVIRRCREAGLLPAGKSGWNGVSAQVTTKEAALLLIALAAPGAPIDAPAEAERIGDFRLRARDHSASGDPEPRREHLDGLAELTFLVFLAHEIDAARGAVPHYEPASWCIEGHEASQIAPDRLVFVGMPGQPDGLVRRVTIISASLMRLVVKAYPMLPPGEIDAAAVDMVKRTIEGL